MPFRLRLFLPVLAMLSLPATAFAQARFLDANVAFRFSARMLDARTVEATWKIADGYYMYRERFAFRANGAQLGAPIIPAGKIKFDETFNKDVEMYRDSITIRVPVESNGPFKLIATGQGCADQGLCYPPQSVTVNLARPAK